MSRHVEGQQKFCQIHRVWDFCEEDREYYHAECNATIRDQRKEIADLRRQLAEAQQAQERAEKSLSEVDDVLVVNWVGPRKDGDYRRALHNLVTNAIREYNDPRISEVAAKTIQDLTAANSLLRRAQEALEWIDNSGAIGGHDHPRDLCKCGNCMIRRLSAAITAHLKP